MALEITQRRSSIGGRSNQRATLRTLGLHRIGDRVVRPDTAEVRGMVMVVTHLVTVEHVDAEPGTAGASGGKRNDV